MRKILTYISLAIIMGAALASGQGCEQKVGYTSISIQDSVRHYTPILRGQKIRMSFEVRNTGRYPLVIEDIQPSCGCIIMSEGIRSVVPPGKRTIIGFTYDSEKNSGFVSQTVRIYGNIAPNGIGLMNFDINVVPKQGEPRDYEEYYSDKHKSFVTLKNYSTAGGYGTEDKDSEEK